MANITVVNFKRKAKMEIKAELKQPYTDKQRLDFIVEQNHKLGYEIKETEAALEAWGYSEEEKQEQEREQRNQEIDNKIKELSEMASTEMVKGNDLNVETYKAVIKSLEESKV